MEKNKMNASDFVGNKTQLPEERRVIHIRKEVAGEVRNSYQLLSDMGMDKLALELEKIYNELFKEHFTVAVVGEFNRGKSTFVNRILKKNVVPEGILPTTSLLTRIRYAEKDILEIYDNQGQQIKKTSLTLEEWDGFMAGNFDTGEFEGVAIAGVRLDWLAKTGIEFVDTPGAGDLEEARIKVIEEALLGCDGAIIAVNATQALSLSEQLFIKERLIMKKNPYLLMIVTKLDEVNEKDRVQVLQYIEHKMEKLQLNIPIYVPYTVEMPDDSFDASTDD